jgi:hypothetical protein
VNINRAPVVGRGLISGRNSLRNLKMKIVVFGVRSTHRNKIIVFKKELNAKSLKSIIEE